ncbi:MAG: hypothetical protein JNL65_12655 [Saprospiraceae bacterium]|nr:hypothetical protein [Saprospiraceae bacterium]
MGRTSKRLLIGASSPVGYFYEYDRVKIHGKPAPILETPLSYCLLYDEIWFLSRKVCPHNMENLSFVHFVDEDLMPKGLPLDFAKDQNLNPFGEFPWESWKDVIKRTIGLRWSYDNHSSNMQFGELRMTPTPGNYLNLLVDRYVAAMHEMDLVENSANLFWSQEVDNVQLKLSISEKLLTSSIVSLQTINGPWHPEIHNLREDSLLKKYRQKIQDVSVNEINDVDKRIGELSKEFEKISLKIVSEQFETTGLFTGTAMFLVGLIPTIGNIIGGGQVLNDIYSNIKLREQKGWVGFLGRAKSSLTEL